jgi:hypothetical protein
MEQQLQHEEAQADIAKAVENMSSKRKAVRLAAAETLRQLEAQAPGQQAVDTLLKVLKQEAQKRENNRRDKLIVAAVIFFLMLVIALFGKDFPGYLVGSLVGLIVGGMAATQGQKNASMILAQFDDVRAVGPLAAAREFGDKNLRAVCDTALIRLLPRLQANHADLLNEDQRTCLRHALYGKDTGLTLAILKGLEQVGNADDLPSVEGLARGEGHAALNMRVQNAAKDCLIYLRPRAEEERARPTLLRASIASATAPDTLLRPAEGVPAADPQQLLRAGTTPDLLE